jgi:hypothetical protein
MLMSELQTIEENRLAELSKVRTGNFYGTINLKYEAGKVVSIKVEQVIKPVELTAE